LIPERLASVEAQHGKTLSRNDNRKQLPSRIRRAHSLQGITYYDYSDDQSCREPWERSTTSFVQPKNTIQKPLVRNHAIL